MWACGCANPICQINGCQIVESMRGKSVTGNPDYKYQIFQQTITAEQVRQIVREEIANALKGKYNGD